MPRIPTYETMLRYQIPQVKNVPVTTPIREGLMDKKFFQMEDAISAISAWNEVDPLVSSVAKSAGGVVGDMRWKLGKKKELQQPEREEVPGQNAVGPTDLFPARDNSMRGSASADFAAPQRNELLQYAKTKLASAEKASVNERMGAGVALPSQRLENYFNQSLQESASNMAAGQAPAQTPSLLVQDYAVLQHDLQQAGLKEQRTAARAGFERAGDNFVQMASLIKTPQALREYIDGNMAKAAQEGAALQLKPAMLKARGEKLKTAAVMRSVEMSLAENELNAAVKVFEHFAEELPGRNREMLEAKLQKRAEEQLGESLFNEAKERFSSAPGEWDEAELKKFINGRLAPQAKQTQEAVRDYIGLQRAQDKQNAARLQSIWHDEVLQTALAGRESGQGYAKTAESLLGGRCLNAADFKQKNKALRQLFTAPQQQSKPEMFNRIYNQTGSEKVTEKEIDRAFDDSEINAKDYFLLKSHYFSAQTGESLLENKLLAGSVERMCSQLKLGKEEAENVKYAVFSGSGSMAQKAADAKAVKELFSL